MSVEVERASDLLEPTLQVVGSHQMGAENRESSARQPVLVLLLN